MKSRLGKILDSDSVINSLSEAFSLREPLILSAIKALQLPVGSTGLDAGCGVGLPTLFLAEIVGASGHITGLDIASESVGIANNIAQQTGFSKRTSFQKGHLNNLPFDENSFDWAWSSDCVGYSPMNPLPLILELKRVSDRGVSLPSLSGLLRCFCQGTPSWRLI